MDFGDNGSWEWQDEYSFQGDPLDGESHRFWGDSNQNIDIYLNLLDEQTPVKDCGDLGYQASNAQDKIMDYSEESLESSQGKRRRMLQFTSEKNKDRRSMIEEELSEDFSFSITEDQCALNYEGLNQFSEDWFADCLNEGGMTPDLEAMGVCVAHNYEERSSIKAEKESSGCPGSLVKPLQKLPKGKKVPNKPPAKPSCSVAYPFALIKPYGDVSLNSINQRIQAPPRTRIKHNTGGGLADCPSSSYSGKPVVEKTKIHTAGRKGSITIMRTCG